MAHDNKYLFFPLMVHKSVGGRGSGLIHGFLIHFGPVATPGHILTVNGRKAGRQVETCHTSRPWLGTVTVPLTPHVIGQINSTWPSPTSLERRNGHAVVGGGEQSQG